MWSCQEKVAGVWLGPKNYSVRLPQGDVNSGFPGCNPPPSPDRSAFIAAQASPSHSAAASAAASSSHVRAGVTLRGCCVSALNEKGWSREKKEVASSEPRNEK